MASPVLGNVLRYVHCRYLVVDGTFGSVGVARSISSVSEV